MAVCRAAALRPQAPARQALYWRGVVQWGATGSCREVLLRGELGRGWHPPQSPATSRCFSIVTCKRQSRGALSLPWGAMHPPPLFLGRAFYSLLHPVSSLRKGNQPGVSPQSPRGAVSWHVMSRLPPRQRFPIDGSCIWSQPHLGPLEPAAGCMVALTGWMGSRLSRAVCGPPSD